MPDVPATIGFGGGKGGASNTLAGTTGTVVTGGDALCASAADGAVTDPALAVAGTATLPTPAYASASLPAAYAEEVSVTDVRALLLSEAYKDRSVIPALVKSADVAGVGRFPNAPSPQAPSVRTTVDAYWTASLNSGKI